MAAILAIIGGGSWFGYQEYTKRDRLLRDQQLQLEEAANKLVSLEGELQLKTTEVNNLTAEVAAKQLEIEKLDLALRLLKTDQRLAQLNVLSINRDETGRAVSSQLEFMELSPNGEPISEPKQFELPGDLVYIDNWIVKFDDSYVEKGDIERGTSLCLFRRIFSEEQTPNDGFSLDEVGLRPQAYAQGGAMGELESQLWAEFWEFANNPQHASTLGIRAAHGEAVSIKVREGKSYAISLRASDGLSIRTLTNEN